jgi:hypothetical protein
MMIDVPEGLNEWEAKNALTTALMAKHAQQQRAREQREDYEASLRRQGYTEEQIKRR